MFSQVIRSLLLLQVIFIVAPLIKTLSISGWKFLLVKGGLFLCMLSVVFCDVQLLPEVFVMLLVFINILTARKEARQLPEWLNYVLLLSLVVFVSFLIFRSGVLSRKQCRDDTSLAAIDKNDDRHCLGTVGDTISVSEAEKMAKAAYEHLYGEGSYEKAQIEKRETDSAYMFSSAHPAGTNYVFTVMKHDGKRVSFEQCGHPNGAQDEK